jgi:hypothetical protein
MTLSSEYQPDSIDDDARLAIQVWNLMNGELNWTALPIVCEMVGVTDIEPLIARLCAIRDYQRKDEPHG